MKYFTIYRGSTQNIIKEFDTLDELNIYYGFNLNENMKFPLLKENVMGIFSYMIVDRR